MSDTGLEHSSIPAGKATFRKQGDAESDALPSVSTAGPAPTFTTTPLTDPELAAVVAAWATLPTAIRAGIVAMVAASSGTGGVQ